MEKKIYVALKLFFSCSLILAFLSGPVALLAVHLQILKFAKEALLILCLVMCCFGTRVKSRSKAVGPPPSVVSVLYWAWIITMAVGVLVASYSGVGISQAIDEMKIVCIFSLMYIVAIVIGKVDISSIYRTILRYFVFFSPLLTGIALIELNIGTIGLMTLLKVPYGVNSSMWIWDINGSLRPDSLLTDPFSFGDVVAVMSIVLFASVLFDKATFWRAICALLSLVNTFISTSRDAIIMAAVGYVVILMVFVFIRLRRHMLAPAITCLFAGTVVLIGYIWVQVHNSPIVQGSLSARLSIWTSTLINYPFNSVGRVLFGYGMGLLGAASMSAGISNSGQAADNFYLLLIVDGGFITLLVFLLLCLSIFVSVSSGITLSHCNSPEKAITVAALATLISTMVSFWFRTQFESYQFSLIYWIIIGAGVAAASSLRFNRMAKIQTNKLFFSNVERAGGYGEYLN